METGGIKMEEVVEKLDPIEVEKALLKREAEKAKKPLDDEEVACMMLKLYTPRFVKLVDQLKSRQLKRAMKSLVEYPLGNKDYKHTDQVEAECVAIGRNLLDAKAVLMWKTYTEHSKTIMQIAEEAVANTTLEFGENAEEQQTKVKEVT